MTAQLEDIPDIERETARMLDEATALVSKIAAAHPSRARRLHKALARLKEIVARPATIALAGEFNSGKSTLCNELTGLDTLPTDFLATTSVPTRLFFMPMPVVLLTNAGGERWELGVDAAPPDDLLRRVDVGLPADILRELELIDTPGLADPDAPRAARDLKGLNADAVIWCTPATQAWKESERTAWQKLPDRTRHRTLLVLTFCDLVDGEAAITRVAQRLEDEAGPFRAIVRIASKPGRKRGHARLLMLCQAIADEVKLERIEKASRLCRNLLGSL